ncbi:MAG TPA: NADP-dependent oxidoreductase [Oceanospirillaceae bacterium]|nr:NADP-dependent oxidoreductase [Oceanospirillaceae bacterium]
MQAMLLNAFANPGVFTLGTFDKPTPGPGQVLIRNIAAGINPIDWKTATGGGPAALQGEFPIILGWECAGVIEAVGEQVKAYKVGDQVLGFLNFPNPARCFAEYVVADIAHIAPKPEAVSFLEAGAMPLAGLTAWQALALGGHDLSGQKVLILAGAGGVGHLAIQIAKLQGAAHVATTASTQRHALLTSLGADACYDYNDPQAMREAGEFDLIIDGIGGDTGMAQLAFLQQDGLLVTLPSVTADQIITAAQVQGKRAQGIRVNPNGNQLRTLSKAVADAKISILIAQSFTLEQLNAAMDLSRTGHAQGKIVIEISC